MYSRLMGEKTYIDTEAKMPSSMRFNALLEQCDPDATPVLVVGNIDDLQKLQFDAIRAKFGTRVNKELFDAGLKELKPTPFKGSACPLYLNKVKIACLPTFSSRHNAPSNSHFLAETLKTCLTSRPKEYVVILCQKSEVFAYACASARAVPEFNLKSGGKPSLFVARIEADDADDSRNKKPATADDREVIIEFLIVDNAVSKSDAALTDDDINALEAVTAWIRTAARLVDTPTNIMHNDTFIDEVKALCAEMPSVELNIIRGDELLQRGLNTLHSVGQAAAHPPALIVLSYKPDSGRQQGEKTKTVAWVGKGIMFDTGGLCIKTPMAVMCGMKRDMGGAAAILGAFCTAVTLGFKNPLHAVLCMAENSISSNATRPDDIVKAYSGKTIEINNTDAEGRLVLADGVAFAKNDLKADIIVDMATLTGAQGIATGRYHAAVLTNNAQIERAAVLAGRVSGDMTYPIIFAPELHFEEFRSVMADMKNSVAQRNNAVSSCAGLFIFSHIGFDWPGVWLHVDMAAPAYNGERATGYGVALLTALFGQLSNNALVQNLPSFIDERQALEDDMRKLDGTVDQWLGGGNRSAANTVRGRKDRSSSRDRRDKRDQADLDS